MDFLLELGSWFTVGFIIIIVGIVALIVSFFQKVEQGKALIVNIMRREEPVVTFTGRIVFPIVHKAEVMDISLKTIEIDRRGREGLICKDNIRADIKVAFFVRVNPTQGDVTKVARSIGCERASDHQTLEELFSAKFSEALKTVGKQLEFEELYKERDSFRDKIIEVVGEDLNGYKLEDAAIDYLEQTPLKILDSDNILDSQGIRKITELTSAQRVRTNEFENQEKMKIAQQDVTAREAILELERRQADAEAKQEREIQNVCDREKAETETVASQERLKSGTARIHTEEQIAIHEQNKTREIDVAEQNRLRVVGIEEERVKLAREQEIITREREVELQRIAKEKALEEERRNIAEVIRERIAVEKTVAEEEERIKELRMISEADRDKQVRVIKAEAEAQEALVLDIKQAEAAQEVAKHSAQEKITIADAEREVADKTAAAKIRLAEGMQAEEAATGLAQVTVKEANAMAIEKEGAAEARAMLEKMQATAAGEEQKGLAQVRVKEANAQAIEKEGIAQAKALLENMQATAAGEKEKGLAQVHVKEANAQAIQKQGMAEVEVKEANAGAIEKEGMAEVAVKEAEAGVIEKQGTANAQALKEHLLAEANGLVEKFKALGTLSPEARAYQEFQLNLEHNLKVSELDRDTQKVVAEKQAQVLAEGLKSANIDIVGGDNLFFERVINSTSLAKSLDSFVNKSDTTKTLFNDYLLKDANLVQDIKEILSNPALSSQDLKNLSLSAFVTKLITAGTPEQKSKLRPLLQWIEKQGIGKASVE